MDSPGSWEVAPLLGSTLLYPLSRCTWNGATPNLTASLGLGGSIALKGAFKKAHLRMNHPSLLPEPNTLAVTAHY